MAKTLKRKRPGIVIIEDHPVMRDGLAAYFTGTGRWRVTGTASTLAEAKKLLAKTAPDLVLLDIQLEDGWGLDIIPWLEEQKTRAAPVMAVYSSYDDYPHVRTALGMGVRVYVTKRRSEQELEQALFKALEGETWIDDTAQKRLQNTTDLFSLLSRRETEILSLVKSGFSNIEIASRLGLSRRTVENILSCIYDKTGIRSRLDLERL
ncbi:MAG: response regulator transcription factor [Treponema sp.]|nr:response regulator transcription factor [Treponema sp.]